METGADGHEVTALLLRWRAGHDGALDRLIPLVYTELRRLAQGQMGRERGEHTLQATALVNEAYMKLMGSGCPDWRDRAHFFAVASLVMRRILLDHARSRLAEKRNGGRRVDLSAEDLAGTQPRTFVALDQALDRLAELDPRAARVVELRYFGGLSVDEVAEVLALGRATVIRDWRRSRVWLLRELS